MRVDSILITRINTQIALLNAGRPLAAFDVVFHPDGVMYANDVLFAAGARQARAKQEPFVNAARKIQGRTENLHIDAAAGFCRFRNLTRFTGADGNDHQIDGLVLQHWQDNRVIEERWYDGALMVQKLRVGGG